MHHLHIGDGPNKMQPVPQVLSNNGTTGLPYYCHCQHSCTGMGTPLHKHIPAHTRSARLATPHAATSAQSQTHLCCNVKTTMTQATNTVHTKMTQPTPKPPDLNPIQSKYPSIPSVHMLPDPSIQHHPTFETLMSWTVGQHGPKNTLKLPFNVAPMHQQTTQRQQQASKWKPTKRLPEAM